MKLAISSGAVCCSVLQCVAVCCSVLQCVAACCSVLQCVALFSVVLSQGLEFDGLPLYGVPPFLLVQRVAVSVRCSVLRSAAVCCSMLQCDAV